MSTQGNPGQRFFGDDTSAFNAIAFMGKMLLGTVATATLVEVMSVAGETVSVKPLVNQVDSSGVATPHGVVYNLPFVRLQGGASAILLDPVAGDIGLAVFASRDISGVKASGAQANPGSARRFDWADGIYVSGLALLNEAATQFIRFLPDAGGITITSPGDVVINGLTISPQGNLSTAGSIVAGAGTADQVGLQSHVHPTAATGAPSAPTPGT